MNKILRGDIFPIIVFGLLSLLIVYRFLVPGYLLSLDAVAVPTKAMWPSFWSASFFYASFVALLNSFVASYWIQKLLLFAIFFLSGWGMFRLVPIESIAAKIFGGFLYCINPFVYERVMAGQWSLLLGYALLPFVIKTIENWSILPTAILITFFVNIAPQYAFVVIIFFVLYSLLFLVYRHEEAKKFIKRIGLLFGILLVFNLNWLLPFFWNSSEIGLAIDQFNRNDLLVFQSLPDFRFGLIFNLLSGYGFWAEAQKYFISPKDVSSFWPVISVFFLILTVGGAVKIIHEKNSHKILLAIVFGILFLLSLDFAGGIALKPFSEIAFWLYDKIPLIRGFREPQKLVGIIMFCIAYFGSVGLSGILSKFKFAVVLLVLPFLYVPVMFNGFWGQLKPVFYPKSWEIVNQTLVKDKSHFNTLFFPWHLYMPFNFNNARVVTNPAVYYFKTPILASQNYEAMPLYSHDIRLEGLHVEGLLRIETEGVNLLGENVDLLPEWGQDLAVIDVKYIILSKDDDWQTYLFLDQQKDLKKVFDSPEISLYENLLVN